MLEYQAQQDYRHDEHNRHEENQAIVDWLSPIDYAPQQNDFISRRETGTGQWLLDSHEFNLWLSKSNLTLFCPGIPGAGKTIITSAVIDHLQNKYLNDTTTGIAYLYCNFKRQNEQKPTDLFLNLLKQLILGQPFMPEAVKDIYHRHKDKRTRPLFEEVSKVLQSVISEFGRSFIIIDALDEYRSEDGGRNSFISEVLAVQNKTNANIFATSRFNSDIEKDLKGSVSLEIRARPDDVLKYLEGHILQLPSFVSRNMLLQDEIMTTIVQAVDGIYVSPFHVSIGRRL